MVFSVEQKFFDTFFEIGVYANPTQALKSCMYLNYNWRAWRIKNNGRILVEGYGNYISTIKINIEIPDIFVVLHDRSIDWITHGF